MTRQRSAATSIAALLITTAMLGAVGAQGTSGSGWAIYTDRVRHITCGDLPVLLDGNHTDLTLSGPCRYVRLDGAHNDVTVTVTPGATIEITGAHNDVYWQSLDPQGPAPMLLNHGYSNTFHHGTGDE
jgi:Protein of unknown function (DUF3060)